MLDASTGAFDMAYLEDDIVNTNLETLFRQIRPKELLYAKVSLRRYHSPGVDSSRTTSLSPLSGFCAESYPLPPYGNRSPTSTNSIRMIGRCNCSQRITSSPLIPTTAVNQHYQTASNR